MTNKGKKLYLGCPVIYTNPMGAQFGAVMCDVLSEDLCHLQVFARDTNGTVLIQDVPRQRDLDAPAIPHSWRWSPGS